MVLFMHQFKKTDIYASAIIGEIVALFLLAMASNLKVTFPFIWSLLIIFPILAPIGLAAAYFIGKKIPVIYQIAKFSLVGFSNVAVDFGVLNLLMWQTNIYSGRWVILLNALSFTAAATNSYLWNKFWTFQSKESSGGSEFVQFFVVAIIGALVNTGIVYGLTTFISPVLGLSKKLWANLAKVLATFASLVWDFIGYKFIVFKK